MIAIEDTVLILLAAGRGSRFGDIGSKLAEPFLGRAVGLHVAVALEDMPFRRRIAVVGQTALDYGAHGFDLVANDDPDQGMARSVRLGVEQARLMDAAAVLIALADMPRITAAHVWRLFDAADSHDAVVASSDGRAPKPPALFGRRQFDFLLTLEGDAGARDLVRRGRHVVTTPAELIDVDTPEELAALRASVGAVHEIMHHQNVSDRSKPTVLSGESRNPG
ncbi:NTP transferase domain-containing protein [Sphingomonas bacterium]|uniref:nucleotidyltransferase family protein n=1 Tax=Sphingomonas bacterium TaxID=1895847 RepID=UPI001574EFDB|nr:nucleotidyltransferase family protein [Sphingomonas bacterium]